MLRDIYDTIMARYNAHSAFQTYALLSGLALHFGQSPSKGQALDAVFIGRFRWHCCCLSQFGVYCGSGFEYITLGTRKDKTLLCIEARHIEVRVCRYCVGVCVCVYVR